MMSSRFDCKGGSDRPASSFEDVSIDDRANEVIGEFWSGKSGDYVQSVPELVLTYDVPDEDKAFVCERCDAPPRLPATDLAAILEHVLRHTVIPSSLVSKVLDAGDSSFAGHPARCSVRSAGAKIVIFGDLHGHLQDLLHVLRRHGPPSKERKYLFNGDMVDRGGQSIEVLVVVLALRLYYGNVYIVRGNHETRPMGEITRLGLADELALKYHRQNTLWVESNVVFRWLPVCAVLDGTVMIAHGGPAFQDRGDAAAGERFLPHGLEILDEEEHERGSYDPQGVTGQILWNDIQNEEGVQANFARGAGYVVGPRDTHAFLAYNNLTHMIRSHQVKDRGFEVQPGGRAMTVFSAANYEGLANEGSVVVVERGVAQVFSYRRKEAAAQPERIMWSFLVRKLKAIYDARKLITKGLDVRRPRPRYVYIMRMTNEAQIEVDQQLLDVLNIPGECSPKDFFTRLKAKLSLIEQQCRAAQLKRLHRAISSFFDCRHLAC